MLGRGLSVALLVAVGLSFHAVPVPAATIHVTTEADEYDVSGSGKGCSLREAVTSANKDIFFGGCSKGQGPDTILVPAGLYELNRGSGDDTNVNGDLDVVGVLEVSGAGLKKTTIDAQKLDRVFHALPSSELALHGVTLRNGKSSSNGGALLAEAIAYLFDLSIAGSTAADRGGGLAIASSGRASLDHCILEDNHGSQGGGGIWNAGQLGMFDSSIRYNEATGAAADGGGILNVGFMAIAQTSFYGNHAEGQAGAIANRGVSTVAMLINATVSGNGAKGNAGGLLNAAAATAGLFNVTLAGNRADSNSDGTGQGGGIFVDSGDVSLANTILADNTEKANGAAKANDCRGTLDSLGYNLIETTTGCSLTGISTGNKIAQDAGLEALADNGGAALTQRLKSSSPAIDAGDPNGCKDLNHQDLGADGRSSTRPIDYHATGSPRCDIGAYEAIPFGFSCFAKPAAPTLAEPAEQSTIEQDRRRLAWNDVPCTTRYKILVRVDSPQGRRVARAWTQDVARFRSEKSWKVGKTYYWRVKACNSLGCSKSPWSSFHVVESE